jgi:hypothetical protein
LHLGREDRIVLQPGTRAAERVGQSSTQLRIRVGCLRPQHGLHVAPQRRGPGPELRLRQQVALDLLAPGPELR